MKETENRLEKVNKVDYGYLKSFKSTCIQKSGCLDSNSGSVTSGVTLDKVLNSLCLSFFVSAIVWIIVPTYRVVCEKK